jgi:hypothetical protein
VLQPGEEMDLTPLDFTEVERWVFRTVRVTSLNLPEELRYRLESIVTPVVEAVSTVQRFSADHTANYDQARADLQRNIDLESMSLTMVH